jgi:hypothetical protein
MALAVPIHLNGVGPRILTLMDFAMTRTNWTGPQATTLEAGRQNERTDPRTTDLKFVYGVRAQPGPVKARAQDCPEKDGKKAEKGNALRAQMPVKFEKLSGLAKKDGSGQLLADETISIKVTCCCYAGNWEKKAERIAGTFESDEYLNDAKNEPEAYLFSFFVSFICVCELPKNRSTVFD